jgi:hypothetical protein
VAIVLANPTFAADWSVVPRWRQPFSLRVSALRAPLLGTAESFAHFVPADRLGFIPRVANLEQLFARLSSYWTGPLWQYRESGEASFQLWIDTRGSVKQVRLLESDEPAQTQALARLVRDLRFEPSIHNEVKVGVVGVIQVSVDAIGDSVHRF